MERWVKIAGGIAVASLALAAMFASVVLYFVLQDDPVEPGAPLEARCFPSDARMDVYWCAPSNDGGDSIDEYRVFRGSAPSSCVFLASVKGGEDHFTDDDVDNNVTYYYRISARNVAGEGPLSGIAWGTPTFVDGMKMIANAGTEVYSLSVWGDKVVWCESVSGEYDVFMYDIPTRVKSVVCDEPGHQMYVDIYGEMMVWSDDRSGQSRIYAYNITNATGWFIWPSSGRQVDPSIYEDKIVWMDDGNGYWDIVLYDLSKKEKRDICTNPEAQIGPKISRNRVVWSDCRDGEWDIYSYDLRTGRESVVSGNPACQYVPEVYGDKVVFCDDSSGNFDVFVYDFTTRKTSLVQGLDALEWGPVAGEFCVVWADYANGAGNWTDSTVWSGANADASTPIDGYTPDYECAMPGVHGHRMVWLRKYDDRTDIILRQDNL